MNLKMARACGFILIVITFGLAGCQTAPQQVVCDNQDWFEIGRQLGVAGRPHRGEEQRRQCGPMFDAVAESIYLSGYNNGLSEFCTAENAYAMGKAGQPAPALCPRPLDATVAAAHRRGQKARELTSANEILDRKISSLSQKIKRVKHNDSERVSMLSELSELQQERQANRRRLEAIERQVN